MPKIACEQCKKTIGRERYYELKEPCELCSKCNCVTYEESKFCSKECLLKYLSKKK